MTNATCPDRTVFSRLLMGDLPDEELALAVEHLEECESCLEAIREASANQPLPSGIRHWAGQTRDTVGRSGEPDTIATDPAGCSPRIDSLVVRLMELMRQAPDADTLPSTGEVSQGTGDPQAEDAYRCLRPPQAADELGRLGPYRVLKVLGQGGMGVVFQAQDMRLNRLCALKVMRPEIAKRKGMKDRFLREARAAAALECDYVLPIYQVDEDNGVPFIAMPFLTGMSLEDWLQAHQRETPGEGLPPAEILKLASDIANGLSVAHAHGMIHRDIKPANIWLDNNVSGRARILDFGLARFSDTAGEQHLTQAGTILGTPSYMAPEQAKSGQVDARADLFSLGVVLYRLCTGDLPFRGHDSMATLLALTGQHPPAPSQVNVATPKSLSDLVMRLLEKDPSQRIGSAQEVLDEAQRIERELAARPNANVEETSAEIAPLPARFSPTARRASMLTLCGLAALLAGIILYWQTGKGTVRIEINAAGISAQIDGEGATITQADKPSVRLSPGDHGLRIKHGDLDFETDKFVLARDGNVDLRIELLPGVIRVAQGEQILHERALDVPSASGKTPSIDLLGLVDLSRDAVAGEWQRRDDGALVSPREPPFTRIEIPYVPAEEYSLEIVVQRQSAAAAGLALGLVAAGNRFRVGFDKLVENDLQTNVEARDGKGAFYRGQVLHEGRPTRIRCTVRKGHLLVEAEDQPLIDWAGDLNKLMTGDVWATPHASYLMIGNTGGVLIHEMKLTIAPRIDARENAQGDKSQAVEASPMER